MTKWEETKKEVKEDTKKMKDMEIVKNVGVNYILNPIQHGELGMFAGVVHLIYKMKNRKKINWQETCQFGSHI